MSEEPWTHQNTWRKEEPYTSHYFICQGKHTFVWHPLIYGPIEQYINNPDYTVKTKDGKIITK